MIRKRIKRKYYILVNILLILFFALILLKVYVDLSKDKIKQISEDLFEKEVYTAINTTVYDSMNRSNLDDMLEIYQNDDGEILYVDYNLKSSYQLFQEVSTIIKNKLNKNMNLNHGFVYDIPFFISSDNAFFSNIGPKIKIKINYINSILTNFYTKITNYGLNNALVEGYIKITIEGRIVTPVSSEEKKLTYDLLVSSKIINGRVPIMYGNYLTSNSSIFDVPIEK